MFSRSKKFRCLTPALGKLYSNLNHPIKICRDVPGFWNITGYEREWPKLGKLFDFLNPQSEIYWLKLLEKEIYLSYFDPYLAKIPRGKKILDAGGGVGRFSLELGKRNYQMTLLDACRSNLAAAQKHLAKNGIRDFEILWADVADLGFIPSSKYAAVFGIELLSYLTDTEKGLRELIRVTEPGGLIFLSVEGKYGSVLADPNIPPDQVDKILNEDILLIEGDRYTRYFTRDGFKKIIGKCGLEIILLEGCHYLAEGPFQRLLDERRLSEPEYRKEILAREKQFRDEPTIKDLARVWAAVARKPVTGNKLPVTSRRTKTKAK